MNIIAKFENGYLVCEYDENIDGLKEKLNNDQKFAKELFQYSPVYLTMHDAISENELNDFTYIGKYNYPISEYNITELFKEFLINALNDDHGINEKAYDTLTLMDNYLNNPEINNILKYVDCFEGRFCLTNAFFADKK